MALCYNNAIASVAIPSTTLNNVTGGCTGTYNSFPASGSTTASLVPNVPYTMNVGVPSGSSNTQVAIWIDYNQNGIYETSEYTLINSNITAPGPGSGSFIIPPSALPVLPVCVYAVTGLVQLAWTSADACTNRSMG
ncbi:MAG: GEVED domain-containing protein [Bacteroidia bacterium]